MVFSREAGPLKIATFNINNINKRLHNLMAWLATAQPDVVCLQELKVEQRAFPASALRDLGYRGVWLGERSWNGVAILARECDPVLTLPEKRRLVGRSPQAVDSLRSRGSALFLRDSATDSRFPKYPTLPVVRCAGYKQKKAPSGWRGPGVRCGHGEGEAVLGDVQAGERDEEHGALCRRGRRAAAGGGHGVHRQGVSGGNGWRRRLAET